MDPTALQLAVEEDRIIVSMAGTSFRAIYSRSRDARDHRPLVEALAMSIDKEAPVSRKEFEAEAWAAATAKARELGWLA